MVYEREGLFASSYECPKCNEQMGLNERKSVVLDGFEWRCRKKATQKACSTITSLSIYGVSRSLTQRRDFPEFFESSCYTLPSTWEGSTIRKNFNPYYLELLYSNNYHADPISRLSTEQADDFSNETTSKKTPTVSLTPAYILPYQFGLAIHQNDHQGRRRFVEWAQNEIAVVPDFHKRILFSDEAHFCLNGYVNKQNCRIWSEANPQVNVETPLHPEKLTVWCALWAGGILLQKR
ncbi:hypothetical protein TNCV_578051 [Trichonephila clavipes]|nr:hypothetical protein TNCV_578051 [Trichonephila clavipes]